MEEIRKMVEGLPECHKHTLTCLIKVVDESESGERPWALMQMRGYALALQAEGLIGIEEYEKFLEVA